MSRRRQLLVLFTTVPLLMFGATIGVAAKKDFSICTSLKGTGAGYGLCRAGVAVGCPDDTGSAQACANIEDHFLTVTGEPAPWLILVDACPCIFDDVLKASPPTGPWGGSTPESPIVCQDVDDELGSFLYREVADRETPPTILQAGELPNNGALFCVVAEDDGEGILEVHETLDERQRDDCLSKLNAYWQGLLLQSGTIVGTFSDDCST